MSGPKGVNHHCAKTQASVPVEHVTFEKEPSLIVVDRCEDAEQNCFHISTWSRAPSLDAVADGRAVLRFGHRGPPVAKLQEFLNEHHPEGEPLEVDGYFGPETEARLRSFQEKKGLEADGIVGTETMGEIADVVVRGLMVDERFSNLPDHVQRSALNRIEGTASSEEKRQMAEILRSEGFAALKPESQERIVGSSDPAAVFGVARMMNDALSVVK